MAESKIRIAQVEDDGNVIVNDTVQGVSVRGRQNSTKIVSISADDHVILKDVKDRLEEYVDSVIESEDKKKSYAELTKLSKDFAVLKDSLHGGSDEPNESMAQTPLARLHDAVGIAMTSRALREVGQQRLKEIFEDLSDEVLHIRPGSLLIRLKFFYSTQFTKFLKTILSKDFLLFVTKDITGMLLDDCDKYLKVECGDPGYASGLLVLLESYVKDLVVLESSYDATAAVKTCTDLYKTTPHFDFTVAFKCRLTMVKLEQQTEQSKAEQKRRQFQVIEEVERIPKLANLYKSIFKEQQVQSPMAARKKVFTAKFSRSVSKEGLKQITSSEKVLGNADTERTCDECKDNQPADHFCINCQRWLCSEHHDIHKIQTDQSVHQIVSAKQYKLDPEMYEAVKCRRHREIATLHCVVCSEFLCERCKDLHTCSAGRMHKPQLLSQLVKKYTKAAEICIKKLVHKMDSLDRKCEDARNGLGEIEENCSYLRDKASALATDQMRYIKKECISMMDEIDEFEQKSKIAKQNYVMDIFGTVEQLRCMKYDLENILKLKIQSQIVKRFAFKIAGAERLLQLAAPDLPLTRKQISFVSGHNFKLQLKSLPTSLDYITTYVAKTKSTKKLDVNPQINYLMEIERRTEYDIDHLSVNFVNSMSLMCGTSGGIRILDAGFKEFNAVTGIGAIEDVVKYRDKYIVLPYCDSIKAYHEVTMKQDEKFPHIPTRDSCHLSLCNGRLAVLEKDTQIVKIYDLDSSRIDEGTKVDMSDNLKCIDRVCLLPDGRMLVLDSGSESLVLYDYIDETEIWKYEDLQDIKTICSDEAGFAYAYNHTKELLHIISPDGVELNDLYPTKIPKGLELAEVSKEVMDMSVSGNKLALACGTQGVLIFELQFDD